MIGVMCAGTSSTVAEIVVVVNSRRRVIVTGSRTWTNVNWIRRALDRAREELGDYTLVHGDARGADRIAASYCWASTEAHPADWERYGKRAGYVRNAEMVSLGADLCLAFIDNHSRGATMCADLAAKAGIPVRRYYANG